MSPELKQLLQYIYTLELKLLYKLPSIETLEAEAEYMESKR